MHIRILIIIILLNPMVAVAEVSTTESLFIECKEMDSNERNKGYCLGRLTGYKQSIDELITIYVRGYMKGAGYDEYKKEDIVNLGMIDKAYSVISETYGCVRDKTTEELANAFLQWTEQHPEKLDKDILFTVRVAFREHFPPPCEKIK